MSRIVGMFDTEDLLERFPEVAAAAGRMPEFLKSYRANKILFACHAVSLARTDRPGVLRPHV
jgi:hypothetical protein